MASSTLLTPGSDPSVLLLRLLGIIAPSGGFLSLNYTLRFPLFVSIRFTSKPPSFPAQLHFGYLSILYQLLLCSAKSSFLPQKAGSPHPCGLSQWNFFMFFLPKYFIFFQQAPISDLVFTQVMQWPNSAL